MADAGRDSRGAPSRSGRGHVAIDGPAGSGKTTVARALARRLGILYLDTGAMYRAVALAALKTGVSVDDEAAVLRLARAQPVRVELDSTSSLGFRVYSGGTELGAELYANEISTVVSVVAAYPAIRALLVERQRALAEEGSVVMAGRDIGTVVLPEAPVKVFLTASVEARVRRRLRELAERGSSIDPVELRAQIVERDRLDRDRAVAPLRPAPDAVVVDSSDLSVDQVVDEIATMVAQHSEQPSGR